MTDAISRMRIEVPEEVLDDLRRRLAATRFPDQIPGSGWDYGTDGAYLRELCSYWRDKFDWRAQEALLNRFDHHRTTIDGQNLHFVHARSQAPGALPLLISHGWPGSVFEFYKIIGPLVDPAAHGGNERDAFHVVCPSLPGYGFSGPTREPGWDVRRVAETFAKLMARLGYAQIRRAGGGLGVDHHHPSGSARSRARSRASISTWWWPARRRASRTRWRA